MQFIGMKEVTKDKKKDVSFVVFVLDACGGQSSEAV